MSTVSQLVMEGCDALGQGLRLEAELLLAAAGEFDRTTIFRDPARRMPAAAIGRFRGLLERRRAGVPVAYLLGRREFYGIDIEVTPDVLIPRPETELLVETVVSQADGEARRVLDLGTGSAAIAVALAHGRPAWQVCGTDTSAAALAVAARNVERLRLANVHLIRTVWTRGLAARAFDVVVSNPPYVCSGDPAFESGDTAFEPRLALDGGRDGLRAIADLVRQAPMHMVRGALIAIEHGAAQGPAVRRLLQDGGFTAVETRRDLAGHERVTSGRR